jgi:hypothetical protein
MEVPTKTNPNVQTQDNFIQATSSQQWISCRTLPEGGALICCFYRPLRSQLQVLAAGGALFSPSACWEISSWPSLMDPCFRNPGHYLTIQYPK